MIAAPIPRLPLEVRTVGGRTIVDGGLRPQDPQLPRRSGEPSRVASRGVGDVAWNDMPQVVIHTPRDVDVAAGGAVFGAVGRSASLELGNAGCGDWTVGQRRRAPADQPGRLRRHARRRRPARRSCGSRAPATSPWPTSAAGLDVDIAGSGDVTVASIAGPLDVRVAGSGDVKVAGGQATTMSVSVAGSGDVDFGGVADSLKARIAGSGDVRAREVQRPVSKTVMGSGGVTRRPLRSRRAGQGAANTRPAAPLTRAGRSGMYRASCWTGCSPQGLDAVRRTT